MRNPWDTTAKGIYNPHDDPIAAESEAEANERAAYHTSIEAEAAGYMADDLAAIEAEAKYYADVIWPKVKVVRDLVTKAKIKIAIAEAKADLAKAKAKTSLAKASLVEIEVNAKIGKNALLRSDASRITKTALNKLHTPVTEADIAAAEADDAVTQANTDLAKAMGEIKNSEKFLVEAGGLSVLGDFLYSPERTKASLVKAKVSLAKAKTTVAKTKANIVKTSAYAVVIEEKHDAEVLVNIAKSEVTEAEKNYESAFDGPGLVANAKAALAKTEIKTKAAVAKAEAEAKAKIDLAKAKVKTERAVAKAKLAKDLSIEAETETKVKADLAKGNLTKAKTDLAKAKDDAEKNKAEALITKAKADLILVETEVDLAKAKATEAEAIANLTKAKAILIEVRLVKEDLGAEAKAKAQIEVDIAEVTLDKAEAARVKTETDLAKAKTDLAAATTLTENLNQTNRQPPPLSVPTF